MDEPTPVPQPTPARSFQNTKAFIIVPIILIIIVIAAGSFLLLNKQGSTSSVSTSIASAANSTTIVTSSINSGSSCPCLSAQQFKQILNISAAKSQTAIFNVTFAQNNSALSKLQSHNPEANKTALPAAIQDNLTEAWIVSYNALSAGSSTEVVMKSSNINGFINYFNSETTSSSSEIPIGNINGFHYLYLAFPLFGINTITIEGYTNDYIIVFGLGAPINTTIESANAIASKISNST